MVITRDEIDKAFEKYIDKEQEKKRPPLTDKEYAESRQLAALASAEYKEFKREAMPLQLNWYEKLGQLSGKILSINPDAKKAEEFTEYLRISHIELKPSDVFSTAIIWSVLIAALGIFFSIMVFDSFFFVLVFAVMGISLYFMLMAVPKMAADTWRMRASNQMVLCLFYVVTYMRHTSNIEGAINFAGAHLAPPLSLDMKKILWDLETEQYPSVKESLMEYLNTWKKYNLEFVEAFNLVISSLYEPSEDRRIGLLEKSLQVILEETYEKMLHYAYNLKSPITMLHMLGVILPVLGLVILPLAINFMQTIQWYHIAVLYDVFLPILVYYFGRTMLSKRPSGYGDTDISEEMPQFKVYRNPTFKLGNAIIPIPAAIFAIIIGGALFLIGISPVLMHAADPNFDFHFMGSGECSEGFNDNPSCCVPNEGGDCFIGYRLSKFASEDNPVIIGPFGNGAALLSVFAIAGLGVGIGLYYKLRSSNVIKIREKAKKLEKEFATALFQLGSRLGDELPAEIAFQKAAETMEGTVSGNFFDLISQNIRRLGLSVEQAIFDKEKGAINTFPSKVVESSMKVLSESAKKGPRIAATAIINVSEYINQMHKVNERLQDLMAEIISSMKTQINFMVPVISAIVIGITSMITTIMGKLGILMKNTTATDGVQQSTSLMQMFGDGMPTFYFQIIVGIYVVEIIYILTVLANGIENGSDQLGERYLLGQNLLRSTIVYCVVSFLVMLLFNMVAGQILGGLSG